MAKEMLGFGARVALGGWERGIVREVFQWAWELGTVRSCAGAALQAAAAHPLPPGCCQQLPAVGGNGSAAKASGAAVPLLQLRLGPAFELHLARPVQLAWSRLQLCRPLSHQRRQQPWLSESRRRSGRSRAAPPGCSGGCSPAVEGQQGTGGRRGARAVSGGRLEGTAGAHCRCAQAVGRSAGEALENRTPQPAAHSRATWGQIRAH